LNNFESFRMTKSSISSFILSSYHLWIWHKW